MAEDKDRDDEIDDELSDGDEDEVSDEASDADDDEGGASEDAPGITRRKLWKVFGAGLAVGAAGGVGGGIAITHFTNWPPRRRRSRRQRPPMKPAYIPVASYNMVKGKLPAKVTIVELSDYQ